MKNAINDDFEKISAFIDGEMDKHQIEDFLNKLAEKPNLQNEFDKVNSVHQLLIQSAATTITYKNNILNQIGLDDRAIAAQRRRFYAVYLPSFLIIAFLSIYSLFNVVFSSSDNSDITIKSDAKLQKSQLINKDNKLTKSISLNNANAYQTNTNKSQYSSNSENYSNAIISNNESRTPDFGNATNGNNDSDFLAVNYIDSPIIEENQGVNVKNITHNTKQVIKNNLPISYTYVVPRILENFTVGLEWYDLNSNYPTFESNNNYGLIKNLAINVLYKINDNHSAGISAGFDDFFLKFEGWENTVKYEYTYNAPVYWLGATYQYKFSPIFANEENNFAVSPIIATSLNYTKYGLYTKLNLGTQIQISENTAFQCSINTGALIFQNNDNFSNNWWIAGKYGLNFGIVLNM